MTVNISSIQKFDNTYNLEKVVSINGDNILISIENMEDMGECEYPLHLSAPEPENYQCSASTDYFTLENLSRKKYNIEINVFENYYSGEIDIRDQIAKISFSDDRVALSSSEINIVPDSCFFGIYYSLTSDSLGFNEMIDKLLVLDCRQIKLNPGLYRAFEVNNNGDLNLNPGVETSEPTFILKYNSDFSIIQNTLNEFVAKSDETYGVIFKDNLGNYYNIKK
ncbi:MAG: hypothetical protein PF486_10140 [Prolixibacteraceae bacterium]|nr:hypothetical protein [Prolixibacteraceae bacterium]